MKRKQVARDSKLPMSEKAKILGGIAAVAGLISLGCFLGGYLPNTFFNQRAEVRSCHVFYSVGNEWCRKGSTTKMCYPVFQNVKPNGTTCWQAPMVADFEDRDLADAYAKQFGSYHWPCYWDYQNPCTYAWTLSDTVVVFWVALAFGTIVLLALFGLLLLLLEKIVPLRKNLVYTEV